ncbi:MAG TPA: hypothetical protein VGJ48_14150 [Pyrinomonadaceae bacterium]
MGSQIQNRERVATGCGDNTLACNATDPVATHVRRHEVWDRGFTNTEPGAVATWCGDNTLARNATDPVATASGSVFVWCSGRVSPPTDWAGSSEFRIADFPKRDGIQDSLH